MGEVYHGDQASCSRSPQQPPPTAAIKLNPPRGDWRDRACGPRNLLRAGSCVSFSPPRGPETAANPAASSAQPVELDRKIIKHRRSNFKNWTTLASRMTNARISSWMWLEGGAGKARMQWGSSGTAPPLARRARGKCTSLRQVGRHSEEATCGVGLHRESSPPTSRVGTGWELSRRRLKCVLRLSVSGSPVTDGATLGHSHGDAGRPRENRDRPATMAPRRSRGAPRWTGRAGSVIRAGASADYLLNYWPGRSSKANTGNKGFAHNTKPEDGPPVQKPAQKRARSTVPPEPGSTRLSGGAKKA